MADDAPRPDDDGDVALVRLVLARELETINEYEAYARRAESPSIRAFFLHLAKEEKEHVSEAMKLIHQLDRDQLLEWESADVREEHFAGAKKGESAVAEAPSPVPRFTVGSLKGR